jgi:hypothetical protein
VAVVSAGRPGRVAPTAAQAEGLELHWYVPMPEVMEYYRAGAAFVTGCEGGLSEARNLALADADGRWNVQLSDDLRRLKVLTALGAKPVALAGALGVLLNLTQAHEAHLGGAAPTDNALFARGPRLSYDKFIVGDLMVIDSASTPRFDPAIRLKDDYDFTLQHLATYGIVLRWDHLLASWDHRTNRGGCVAYRTPEVEQADIIQLRAKWPGCIVDNRRRPNEILMRWPAKP